VPLSSLDGLESAQPSLLESADTGEKAVAPDPAEATAAAAAPHPTDPAAAAEPDTPLDRHAANA
jgi:hypothetical protein